MVTMTEPTYEVNFEKLSSLSIADLTGLERYTYDYYSSELDFRHQVVCDLCRQELEKRINDIIIF